MSPEERYNAYLVRNRYVSGGSADPNWTADGNGFWFAEDAPDNTIIRHVDLNMGRIAPLFDVAKVRAGLAATLGHEPLGRGLPFTTFATDESGKAVFRYGDAEWRVDPATSAVEFVGYGGGASNLQKLLNATAFARLTPQKWARGDYLVGSHDVPEQLSPSGEWFASVVDHNITLRSTRDGRTLQVTHDGTPDLYWDIESDRMRVLPGHRLAFSAVNPWSPDSLTLFAYRRDITGIYRMPRMNWLKAFEEVDFIPSGKAGGKLDLIEPVFVDVRSGAEVKVRLDAIEDRFIQHIAWLPYNREALIIVYPRDFKRLDIVAANRETGAVRPILTETADTFVKIQHEAMFAGEHGFRLLPDGSGFLWLSTRDGWNHIYHYDLSGRLIGRLTSGEWPVHDLLRIGADGFVYFSAAIDVKRPYDVHVCRIPLAGGKIEQLTKETGIHAPVFAPNGQAFLDQHSSVDRPSRTDLVKADGTQLCVVSKMDISRFEAVGYRPAEEFTVKAADGVTDLWGVMYKPVDFDPARSYPVIEYIYGGPQTVEARHYFSIDHTKFQNLSWALAQLGYIVFCLDARGSPGRSKAFHDEIYGNWTGGIADHAGAVRQLCARHSWMDADRVGITGHSWGGYFSSCALLLAPETYHAAVSYAPVYQAWCSIIYEPYLDLPQRNRAAYDNADLLRQVGNMKGKLMMVAGTSDFPHIDQPMKMTRALIEAGIDHEFVVVPQGTHHFAGAEEDYLLMKLTGWFDEHVKNRGVAR